MTGTTGDNAKPDALTSSYTAWLQYASDIYVRGVKKYAKAVSEAATSFSSGKHTTDDCVALGTQLANIAASTGVEFASTVLAGPGFSTLAAGSASSWIPVSGSTTAAHKVELVGDFTRGVSQDVITRSRIGVEAARPDGTRVQCADFVLPAGTSQFRLLLNRFDIRSGCYTGQVTVTELPGALNAKPPTPVDVEFEL